MVTEDEPQSVNEVIPQPVWSGYTGNRGNAAIDSASIEKTDSDSEYDSNVENADSGNSDDSLSEPFNQYEAESDRKSETTAREMNWGQNLNYAFQRPKYPEFDDEAPSEVKATAEQFVPQTDGDDSGYEENIQPPTQKDDEIPPRQPQAPFAARYYNRNSMKFHNPADSAKYLVGSNAQSVQTSTQKAESDKLQDENDPSTVYPSTPGNPEDYEEESGEITETSDVKREISYDEAVPSSVKGKKKKSKSKNCTEPG